MIRTQKHLTTAACGLIAGLMASTASAAVISFNMSADPASTDFGSLTLDWNGGDAGNGFDPQLTRINGSEQTGVVSVGNWNNSDEATGSTISNLLNDSGVATTADVVLPSTAYRQGGGFKFTPPSSVVEELYTGMGGQMFNAAGTYTLEVDQIPYSVYDVYVYVGRTDDNGGTQALNVTLTPDGGSGQLISAVALENGASPFDDATSDKSGNYVKYSSINTASFDLLLDSSAGNASTLAGFQIVQVPEPSTFVLVGLFGFAALMIRRRG